MDLRPPPFPKQTKTKNKPTKLKKKPKTKKQQQPPPPVTEPECFLKYLPNALRVKVSIPFTCK